ncbi:MAG: peptidoglycan-binding protein LysM [Bdellovibrionota bacterium]
MGIFDFIKDLGHDKKAEAAKDDQLEVSINQSLQKAGLDLSDFQLQLSKGTATISGTAGSLKDAELARLMVGNHRGVERVNDDGLKVVPKTPTPLINAQPSAANVQTPNQAGQTPALKEALPAKMVTVKKGDTLSKIAKEQLGNANRYTEIFEANKPMLNDPDEIFPGQVLRIPSESTLAAH